MNYPLRFPWSCLFLDRILRCKTRLRLMCLLTCVAGYGMNEVQAATIIYANKNAPANTANNGTSWANAYFELRDALASTTINQATAENPVEIWVAKGTYTPTAGTN